MTPSTISNKRSTKIHNMLSPIPVSPNPTVSRPPMAPTLPTPIPKPAALLSGLLNWTPIWPGLMSF